MTKYIQLQDLNTGEDLSPVVSIEGLRDKDGQKVDLSKLAGDTAAEITYIGSDATEDASEDDGTSERPEDDNYKPTAKHYNFIAGDYNVTDEAHTTDVSIVNTHGQKILEVHNGHIRTQRFDSMSKPMQFLHRYEQSKVLIVGGSDTAADDYMIWDKLKGDAYRGATKPTGVDLPALGITGDIRKMWWYKFAEHLGIPFENLYIYAKGDSNLGKVGVDNELSFKDVAADALDVGGYPIVRASNFGFTANGNINNTNMYSQYDFAIIMLGRSDFWKYAFDSNRPTVDEAVDEILTNIAGAVATVSQRKLPTFVCFQQISPNDIDSIHDKQLRVYMMELFERVYTALSNKVRITNNARQAFNQDKSGFRMNLTGVDLLTANFMFVDIQCMTDYVYAMSPKLYDNQFASQSLSDIINVHDRVARRLAAAVMANY